jgi:hypothetical protein
MFYLGLSMLVLVPVFKAVTHLPPFMGILFGLGLVWLVGDLVQQGRQVDLGGLRVEEVNGMLSQEVLPRYHQMMNDEIT